MTAASTQTAMQQPSKPWWTFPHVWLVISGPAIVVVAACATFWIAVHNPDPVVDEDYYRKGVEINKTLKNPEISFAPALKSRNHSATPQEDQPSLKPE